MKTVYDVVQEYIKHNDKYFKIMVELEKIKNKRISNEIDEITGLWLQKEILNKILMDEINDSLKEIYKDKIKKIEVYGLRNED